MKLSLSFLLTLAATVIAHAAIDNRSFSAVQHSLAVNGVDCPEVTVWSGGEPVGSIATTPVAGASAKKQIAAVGHEPIVVEAALPLSPALLECVADLCANRAASRTLSLTTQAATGPASTLQAANALLTEVRFPALDASSKDAARLTLVFRADGTSPASPQPAAAAEAKPRKAALVSNFRLSIDGLPTARVARIEPFVISRSVADKSTGSIRSKNASATTTVIPDLTLSISQADLADWAAWRDSFLVKGDNGDTAEKAGVLELLSPDLKTPLFTLQLANLGLIRLALPAAESEKIPRVQADLYCETMTIVADPAKASIIGATR